MKWDHSLFSLHEAHTGLRVWPTPLKSYVAILFELQREMTRKIVGRVALLQDGSMYENEAIRLIGHIT